MQQTDPYPCTWWVLVLGFPSEQPSCLQTQHRHIQPPTSKGCFPWQNLPTKHQLLEGSGYLENCQPFRLFSCALCPKDNSDCTFIPIHQQSQKSSSSSNWVLNQKNKSHWECKRFPTSGRAPSAPAPAAPHPPALTWVLTWIFSHFSAFSPSFEDFFTEAPPALLTGSAVPCGGGWDSAWISAPLPAAPTHCPFRGKLLSDHGLQG